MRDKQVGYLRSMKRLMLLGGVVLAAGCTKENPAAKCSTGTCIDPAYPFCDVDGTLSGSAGSCISVSCTPGDFKECRGDVALTCNAMGNNYDELQCQKGCTPEARGCRLCDAGTTVCTKWGGADLRYQRSSLVDSIVSARLLRFRAALPPARSVERSRGLHRYGARSSRRGPDRQRHHQYGDRRHQFEWELDRSSRTFSYRRQLALPGSACSSSMTST